MTDREILNALAHGRVAVIGDLMLDHYVFCNVERISPEAPVPVLHVQSERSTLGGAANVAANISALGGSVSILGIVGEDFEGRHLLRMLQELPNISISVRISVDTPTIVKTRYVAGQQQIVRVDRESVVPINTGDEEALASLIPSFIRDADVLVLSDYGKGLLSDMVLKAAIHAADSKKIPVVVDPKRKNFSAYRGAAFITPNLHELTNAIGRPCRTDDEAFDTARSAIEQTGAHILLTRSKQGMSLFRSDMAPIHVPAKAQEVFDVSGAGDTVVAAFSLALAANLPIETAISVANTAAGVVVGKLGTSTCSQEELSQALSQDSKSTSSPKNRSACGTVLLETALQLRNEWAESGLTVGFTNGCFDIVHPGHLEIITQASLACDRLIVGINDDASVKRLKGESRPVQTDVARAKVIGMIRGVDAVVLFGGDTPIDVVSALKPDLIVKGADYTESEVVGAEIVKAHGGKVLLVPLSVGESTSNLIKRVLKE